MVVTAVSELHINLCRFFPSETSLYPVASLRIFHDSIRHFSHMCNLSDDIWCDDHSVPRSPGTDSFILFTSNLIFLMALLTILIRWSLQSWPYTRKIEFAPCYRVSKYLGLLLIGSTLFGSGLVIGPKIFPTQAPLPACFRCEAKNMEKWRDAVTRTYADLAMVEERYQLRRSSKDEITTSLYFIEKTAMLIKPDDVQCPDDRVWCRLIEDIAFMRQKLPEYEMEQGNSN